MRRFGTMMVMAALALAVAVPVAAAVQQSEVAASLATATKTYRGKGYAPAGWEKFGKLGNATEVRLDVPLKAGHSYQVVGACDKKCTDLDFQLFDAAGKEVDFDAQDDDFPIVAVHAAVAATYTVRVVMSACGQASCTFGVKAFVKS